MKLRTQILLFLFIFGLTPLFASVAINFPMIMDGLELFYHKAHLQNLRADFRDLDQHLASRHETVRLLAKFPEYGKLLGATENNPGSTVGVSQARYTDWVNRILNDQLDIIQILFVNKEGREQFWLERDPNTLELVPGVLLRDKPAQAFINAGMLLEPGVVRTGPIRFNNEVGGDDPTRFMMLQLISPIIASPILEFDEEDNGSTLGAVVVNIDIGGLARAYPNTFWVHNDGSYLRQNVVKGSDVTAFNDFPGLEEGFKKGDLTLWEGDGGDQVIWVPLFVTEKQEPLWVGRGVDPSPITEFSQALELRVVGIVVVLIVMVLLIAHWIAARAESFRQELTGGIGKLLEHNEDVEFSWGGPQEFRSLGGSLTKLAKTHIQHNRDLQAHAKELEESNRYKSEFLANVSHELRTPLNSILLLSKLLANSDDGSMSAEQLKQARVIHDAGSDLTTLINDILDISRIEAGKYVLNLERVDLASLLEGLVDLVRPQTDEKGLELHLIIQKGAPRYITSDGEKVAQILKNFLSNAVKFTGEGAITINLMPNETADQSQYPVRIIVQDTGIGIPQEKHEIVFDAFRQADGSTSRSYGGSGLGLTISRKLARLMGGRIELVSAKDEGSAFSLLMPIQFKQVGDEQDQLQIEQKHELKASSEAPIPEADFSGKGIMVIDDDMRNLLALTPLLERWGLEVTGAGDGKEALETLEEEVAIDLVLVDIMMPEMDGYETMRRIRSQDRYRKIPLIVLSAKSGTECRERARVCGADDFITKPVDPDRLQEVLSWYLEKKQ